LTQKGREIEKPLIEKILQEYEGVELPYTKSELASIEFKNSQSSISLSNSSSFFLFFL